MLARSLASLLHLAFPFIRQNLTQFYAVRGVSRKVVPFNFICTLDADFLSIPFLGIMITLMSTNAQWVESL